MSTLRINNIEAQSIPASPTIDEKVKVTNSSGDILVNIDGKTSGITTIGINTTDGNIKFDANSNVLITGILTATTLAGNFTPDSLEIGSNIKLGNAGVITATSFVGSGANLTGIDATKIITGNTQVQTIDTGSDGHVKVITEGSERLRIDSSGRVGINETSPDSQLHVSGNANAQTTVGAATNTAIRITDTDTAAQSGQVIGEIQFETRDATSAGVAAFITAQGNSSGAAALKFGTGSGGSATTKMVIHQTGNASLGTEVPNEYSNQTTLTINGTSHGRLDLEVGGTLKGSVWGDSGGLGLDAGGNSIEMYTGSAQRVFINTSGQMGIGQNFTPVRHLDIKDSTGANRIMNIRGTGTSGAFLAFLDANTTDDSKCRVGSVGGNNIGLRGDAHYFQNGVGTNRMVIDSSGDIGLGESSPNRSGYSSPVTSIGYNSSNGYGVLELLGNQTSDNTIANIVAYNVGGSSRIGAIAFERSGANNSGAIRFETYASGSAGDRMRIRPDGHLQLQHGLTGLSGGGVIVCAAKSSTGTANQSNYKVDFVVPMGDLGTKQEYEDIRAQFGSGQTGTDWTHAWGGSGILIATVQNNYYWGFRTKIYHITTYGNSSNNVTQLNLLHNYSAAGHGGNSASVDLAVQSHDGKTPKLRATFSGDYWNSNVLTVTYIGSAVASTGNIRQLTTFDSKLTGQDPTWK